MTMKKFSADMGLSITMKETTDKLKVLFLLSKARILMTNTVSLFLVSFDVSVLQLLPTYCGYRVGIQLGLL